jgi:hypothetical protein
MEAPRMKSSANGSVQTPRSLAEIVVQLAFRHYLNRVGFKSQNTENSGNPLLIPELSPREEERFRKVRILDLGIGNGSFLLCAASSLEATFASKSRESEHHRVKNRRNILVRNLWGVDNDIESVNDCRQNLRTWIGSSNGEISSHLLAKIKSGNALVGRVHAKDNQIFNLFNVVQKESPSIFHWYEEYPNIFSHQHPGFDIILCNPPYVTKNLDPETIRLYRSLYGKLFVNRFNLYHLFFARVKELLAPHGIAVFLTANSVLTDQYSKKLRNFVKQSFSILNIVDFVSRNLFPKVLQGVCIVSLGLRNDLRSSNSPSQADVFQTFNASTFHNGKFRHGTIPDSHLFFQGKIISNPNRQNVRILKYLQKKSDPVKKLFDVQSGEIRPADSKIRPLYFKALPKNEENRIFNPILNGKNTGPFLINLSRTRPKARWFQRPAAEDKNPIFRAQHAFTERIVFQRITAREQLRRLVAARIDQDHLSLHPVWVENNLNYIRLPSPKWAFSTEVLLGIFNSLLLNWFLHQINLTAAVPPSDLGLLPIPSQDSLDLSLASHIESVVIEITKQLSTVDSVQQRLIALCPTCKGPANIEHLRNTLDTLVFQLYDLPVSDQTVVTNQMTELHNYFGHH